MKYYHFFILQMLISIQISGLTAQPSEGKSDPKATTILNKLKKQYSSYKTVKADFSMVLEVPERPNTNSKGQLFQQGQKYRISLPELTSFSDSKSVWTYLKKNKEIQLTNAGDKESSSFISPQELISMYEKKDMVYAIAGETTINNKKCTEIEFKPVSNKTDYFKIKMAIDTKAAQLVQAKVFYKDGSRYTFVINKLLINKPLDSKLFIYSSSEWPGLHVEDLRLD